jgi:hypothetical protein
MTKHPIDPSACNADQQGPSAAVDRPRIVTNFRGLPDRAGGRPLRPEWVESRGKPFRHGLTLFLKSLTADALVIDQVVPALLVCLLCRMFIPTGRARVIVVDPVLTPPPSGAARRAWWGVKKLLLRRVDLFLVFQKDVSGIQGAYGIGAERFHYIPFKVNALDLVLACPNGEESYVFTGGQSRRDFATFYQAMAGLGYPAVVLTPANRAQVALHGTTLEEPAGLPHVRLVHDDGSNESWVRHIARAKVVVLPISPDTISPSGIGTYLIAMALGKCVVITDSPATRGILTNEENALIVPPQDTDALREAIRRVWGDDAYRRRIAARGREYALKLGGEEALLRGIATATVEFLHRRQGRPITHPSGE